MASPAIHHVYVPNVDYPSLLAAFQSPNYQTSEGRMALARYWVEVRQLDPVPGFECDYQANAVRLKAIVQHCRAELLIASDEHLQARINQDCDRRFNAYPCWLRTVSRVIEAVGKPMNAIDRFFRISKIIDRIIPDGRAGDYVVSGAGLLFISGVIYFSISNPPLGVVIGAGLGTAAGTALLCAGIYLAIKQKYYQGRQ